MSTVEDSLIDHVLAMHQAHDAEELFSLLRGADSTLHGHVQIYSREGQCKLYSVDSRAPLADTFAHYFSDCGLQPSDRHIFRFENQTVAGEASMVQLLDEPVVGKAPLLWLEHTSRGQLLLDLLSQSLRDEDFDTVQESYDFMCGNDPSGESGNGFMTRSLFVALAADALKRNGCTDAEAAGAVDEGFNILLVEASPGTPEGRIDFKAWQKLLSSEYLVIEKTVLSANLDCGSQKLATLNKGEVFFCDGLEGEDQRSGLKRLHGHHVCSKGRLSGQSGWATVASGQHQYLMFARGLLTLSEKSMVRAAAAHLSGRP